MDNIFKQAKHSFKNKDYVKAKKLYKQAGDEFGIELVKYNIHLCEQKLKNSDEFDIEQYDPVTKLLLDNNGDISLSSDERILLKESVLASQRTKSELLPLDTTIFQPSISSPHHLPESTNDYAWLYNNQHKQERNSVDGLSIIVPTFNRLDILDITLACLTNQQTTFSFEVIIADDGSESEVSSVVRKYEKLIDVKCVRQPDRGYQLCAVRNLGMRAAKFKFIAILDCDMAPNPNWVQSYMELLLLNSNVALIGPRKYVNTEGMAAEAFLQDRKKITKLPEVHTNNTVAGKAKGAKSIDWRLEHFKNTEDLRLCNIPFRFFSGGNVAFSKKWLDKAGWFDEEFTHWGGEDNEFGYRLFRAGCFFKVAHESLAYHQEPPGKENETDREGGKLITNKIVAQKVAYFNRKLAPLKNAKIKEVPLVSVYIPVYNGSKYIERSVNSVLMQTMTDLEVCICDDGSTDNTLKVLKKCFSNNPRVKIMSQQRAGLAQAEVSAMKMAKGYYLSKLCPGDYLELDAIELCLKTFFSYEKLSCVYTSSRDIEDEQASEAYQPSRRPKNEVSTCTVKPNFFMYTMRAWYLTSYVNKAKYIEGTDDIFLKILTVGPAKFINRICHNRSIFSESAVEK